MVTARRTWIAVLLIGAAIGGALVWFLLGRAAPTGRHSNASNPAPTTTTASAPPNSSSGAPVVPPTAEVVRPPAPPSHSRAEPATAPSVPAADVVAQFVRKRMTQASVAFVAPDELARNEPGVAVLRLAPTTIPPSELKRELQEMLSRAGARRTRLTSQVSSLKPQASSLKSQGSTT
ncbi:hypothetical protein LuPra_01834 [Luteitalea pratensis]|uniref:Uncharacterized protein n=1 Tax=Luteitalea pratensis TaxID=1855912 RepID=A0A143PK58_LUTPR|nr:hypothetical protein LuPra_01834 [Luteitalea pratensis]